MRVSRNEIEMTARRAGLGAGLAFGLAEELGRAAAERPGDLVHVVDALDRDIVTPQLDQGAGPATGPEFGPVILSGPCSVLATGPSIVDLLIAGDGPIRLQGLDVPDLLPAYLDRLSRERGRVAEVAVGDDGVITVRPSATTRPSTSPAPTGEVDVDDTAWRRLSDHAARSLVPNDEHSRAKGAGAGLNDTD